MVLAGIVPIAALRGRRQPTVWVSRRLGGLVLMPTGSVLVIGEQLATGVVAGRVPADEFSALVAHALGQEPVRNSRLVAAGDVYCLPWRLVELAIGGMVPVLRRVPLTGFAWRLRWVVFGFALVDAARNDRWYAFVGVAIIALLSWSTSHLNRRWAATLSRLGDDQVRAAGLGGTLAAMIRRRPHTIGDLERATALTDSPTR